MDKEDKKILQAQIGNLEVQIAEYQQIVQELSNKLRLYENKHGTVYKSSRNVSSTKSEE